MDWSNNNKWNGQEIEARYAGCFSSEGRVKVGEEYAGHLVAWDAAEIGKQQELELTTENPENDIQPQAYVDSEGYIDVGSEWNTDSLILLVVLPVTKDEMMVLGETE